MLAGKGMGPAKDRSELREPLPGRNQPNRIERANSYHLKGKGTPVPKVVVLGG